MTTRPMLTQREAAAACGVSRSTIRRSREAGALPDCVQDARGGWLIPVDSLLTAGFRLNAPAPADAPASAEAPAGSVSPPIGEHDQGAAVPRAELERLRAEHALALARAEYGQRLAEAEAEHLRRELAARGAHIADLQRTVTALMPAPERAALAGTERAAVPGQATGGPGAEAAPAAPAGSEPRRRWWGRRD
ncbi:helix-turn-helix domain-containing protein [Streptomyces subrutilus]|uniref:helix-turn-helix domain-containing protein n=1 Tax=Streptomyces subrutilus TaxID=36818 RepID=UPI00343F8451